MEHIDTFLEFLTAFAYRPQVLYAAGGILAGYLLCKFAIHLRVRHRRARLEGRNMVLIEQRWRGGKRQKNANSEYFTFINSAQYGQNNWAENNNKISGVSTIERD